VNTIDVYVGEDMLDLNTTKDDNTPKDELETIAMHSRKMKAFTTKSFTYFCPTRSLYDWFTWSTKVY
jgi:hypothetical protein